MSQAAKSPSGSLQSRRRFLRSATIAGAGITVLPSGVLGGPNAPSNKLNIALIGTAGRARAHFGAVKSENVVALCDVNEKHIESAVKEFPKAKVQRCQIHVTRNVLAKVPRKLKKSIADEIRSIFYASSKSKALSFFERFKERWQKELPSAVKCLENSLSSCLTYLQFPEEEWICLRTTNVIERVNKEFKRRTKSMEILAGERSCYTLLTFICLKMELRWRSKPIGKVPQNLPFFRALTENNFTQNN